MKFNFTDEQEEFRSVLRRFLEDKSPTTEVRRLMETDDGCDPEIWRQLSQDLGLTAIHIPESYGGQGFGIGDLAIAVEEMGRALLCAPYFASTVMAATAILKAGSENQKQILLPDIAEGKTISTLALAEEQGDWTAEGVTMIATQSDDGFRLNGSKSYVLDGCLADLIVVAARREGSVGDEGLSLFTVASDSVGLEKMQLRSMDPTRKLAQLTFSSVNAALLGDEGAAAGPLNETLDVAAICLANEMVGGAERLRESAVDYANMRVQFGRAIGSFQSLKHKAADMLLEVELAKSAAYYAAAAVDDEDEEEDVSALASLAKAAAADVYMQTAIHTIQIHGGVGFTWDNDTHLWFKRAKSSEVFLGGSAYHRERLMQQWNV
ncbi:MAG: Acyl-CoA dehydrogenase [Alphaproteobacteria bacterium MarineAlpha4_Bin2]|nr:MAG: Acyl-CoA dehydrogenase [Alphaproteobacteria bacterium MarineAlpha4_Bin2]